MKILENCDNLIIYTETKIPSLGIHLSDIPKHVANFLKGGKYVHSSIKDSAYDLVMQNARKSSSAKSTLTHAKKIGNIKTAAGLATVGAGAGAAATYGPDAYQKYKDSSTPTPQPLTIGDKVKSYTQNNPAKSALIGAGAIGTGAGLGYMAMKRRTHDIK